VVAQTQKKVMKWNPVYVSGNSKQKNGPLQGTNMFFTIGDEHICDKKRATFLPTNFIGLD
jgi:hypothetical protein